MENRRKIDFCFSIIRNGANIKQHEGASGIPITRIETIANASIDLNRVGFADIYDDKYQEYYLKNGDILMSHINSLKHLGKTAIVKNINEQKIIHGMNLLILRPNKNIIFDLYAKFYFQTPIFYTDILQIANQSVNQSSFTVSKLKELEIPLPPLSEQQAIADKLDKADELRKKDQQLLAKYDELAQSIFIDMFGDPVKNEKGWEVKKLGDVCSKVTDGTHDTPERLNSGIKFITGKHIKPFFIDYDNSDYVDTKIHIEIFKRCNPKYGDILYTNIGVNYGTAAMNTVKYEFSMKNVALIKYDRLVLNGRFLEYLLNHENFKNKLKTIFGVGGAQQFLSLKQIKNIKALLPPLSLQKEFARRIENIEAQKAIVKQQAEKSEMLFQALLQDSFTVGQ